MANAGVCVSERGMATAVRMGDNEVPSHQGRRHLQAESKRCLEYCRPAEDFSLLELTLASAEMIA
jgi:hypothetical protein